MKLSEASIASIEHRLDIVRTNGGVLAASATGDRILTVDVPALILHCRAQAAETARLTAENTELLEFKSRVQSEIRNTDDARAKLFAAEERVKRLRAELARKDEALRKIAGLDVGRHLDICKDIAKAALSAAPRDEMDTLCTKCYGSELTCSVPGSEDESQCPDCKGTGKAELENRWWPMETAPMDGTPVLLAIQFLDGVGVRIGFYGAKFSRYGLNYGDAWGYGTSWSDVWPSECPILGWMPIPSCPDAKAALSAEDDAPKENTEC